VKLLLTSAGIKNASLHTALAELLGKPIAASTALCIPTASYGYPGGAAAAWRFISGVASTPLCELGWKSLGVLELTALPSMQAGHWVPMLQETDALLVGGGDPMYLCHWMRQSGLADLLPKLRPEAVYVGVSAGSLVLTPNVGEEFAGPDPITGNDGALGVVDFSLFPHLDHPGLPDNCMANAEVWASRLQVPSYAIDDQTAVKVVDGIVEVVSEGHWKRFSP